ncbi:AhpC/TSA family protein [Pedobacter sp. MC2016-14]|uniref:TlpA disulfide reductase family protein n=1 Tax=Pedobacter sp. MC2016-14 TaxID=2897327 RepID=UPI001E28C692|nr:TlpA disulfide reductase family protein [Pedobacter sp. MC2016-14]MCD0488979.1 AhpC/TSA family protein [Pedobacter sp. MC2016-14]
MKKYNVNNLLLAIVTFGALSHATAQNKSGYTIKGTMVDFPTGKVYLEKNDGDGHRDSANVRNGKFEFKGKVDELAFYSLYIKDKSKSSHFLLENSNLTFLGQKDSLYRAKVKGGPIYDTYMTFYNTWWKPVTAKAGEIYGRMAVADQGGKVKMDAATRKAFDAEFAALNIMNDSVVNAYAKKNWNSIAAAMVIKDRYIDYPYFDNARALMPLLSKEVRESSFGKQIYARLALDEKTATGKVAPVFSMADRDRKTLSLADFRGKYVLVDFWASWCGPCRKENPNVVAAYKKYHDKGFEILGVSLDSNKEPWLKAIATDQLTWHHVSDLKGWKNEAAALYGVSSVPASFLIGPDGKVIAKDLRGEDLHKKLQMIFATK